MPPCGRQAASVVRKRVLSAAAAADAMFCRIADGRPRLSSGNKLYAAAAALVPRRGRKVASVVRELAWLERLPQFCRSWL